ncbi:hypothetical protein KJ782_07095 [Patescibacteria group bacterium]|nr:hypothetical protein [Patescibacteria group bacterium]
MANWLDTYYDPEALCEYVVAQWIDWYIKDRRVYVPVPAWVPSPEERETLGALGVPAEFLGLRQEKGHG